MGVLKRSWEAVQIASISLASYSLAHGTNVQMTRRLEHRGVGSWKNDNK